MTIVFIDNAYKVKKEKEICEQRLNVKIEITGRKIVYEGETLDEYEAGLFFEAVNFGFDPMTALTLKEEDTMFKRINIKDFTRRKNLEEVKARIIGTQGRTKRTIENISNCKLIIKGNEVGLIGSAEDVANIVTALANLIRGSKQSNVYNFLERINTGRKELD